MKRIFHSSSPGIRLFIPDYSEFIGGRWINHPATNADFTPHYETDDPEIIRSIRKSKGYGERYFEYDPETKRNTTFPLDYGLTEKPGEEEKIIVKGTSKIGK